MRIAIPVQDDVLAAHFGHCPEFALTDVDPQSRAVTGERRVAAPPHEPGLLPRWLAEQGATHIIAGGMGQRALDLFASHEIAVVIGAPQAAPQELVRQFLDGSLSTSGNPCDH
ncbi:NifB/NifX family molybdenum-iron cluster-binding protein [Thiococcus pfennigii]|jgi:predicted Fe-Mo cluster-binding NifX family protein|uniref:NifB/NifX family molybdenum-iron cluster-binding protein n=1 Tax=Thiococcus pfennigii TaxID=1057 RepID=UPI00190611FD|nr:NifB/NifX family molybdenum-iron cluster-binding protein [Thiococcus pfennigii]MBK1700605.1 ATPase [Thiococcus pfennigii]MBK1732555.1 ATPase [Thiococcus pfennigii]